MANLRIPPHSEEAEEAVLGSIMIDKDVVFSVAPFLKPADFYHEAHKIIYDCILELNEKRDPIDLVTVTELLKKAKALKKVGGSVYVARLTEKVATAAHAEAYARIIKGLAVKRELIRQASSLTEMAFDESMTSKEVMDRAEKSIFSLSQSYLIQNFISIKDALADSFDRLDELHKKAGSLRGIPSGYKILDDTLAGMQKSNLIVLAGRPGLGKTAFALNICMKASVDYGIKVGFFSLEMSKEELVDRLLVAQGDIDAWRLKTGRLSDEDFTRLSDAMGKLAEAPIFIDDSPGISVMEMRTKARRLQSEHGLDLLVVDYLQLAVPTRRWDNRVQEVTDVSQGLKNLARELKIPVLALSQLSRAVEQRGVKEPQLADLRESGAIEQDADVVMFLYRSDEEDMENITLKIAKHRNGPLKNIPLRFRANRLKFYEAETKMKEG
jgi:replicative DNA helicase